MSKPDPKTVKTVAEILDVLHRNGFDADSSYSIENFLQDYPVGEATRLVLIGDGKEIDYDDYGKKPLAERLARYSKLLPGTV